jgi:RNA polymerase sigma-70 factor (ECF subfamily)
VTARLRLEEHGDPLLLALREADDPAAHRRLHDLLVRAARAEVHRRRAGAVLGPRDQDDIAQHAADDAMLAVLRKLDGFRGESRFTTWVYGFAVQEVRSQLAQHGRVRRSTVPFPDDAVPNVTRGVPSPEAAAESQALAAALRHCIATALTDRQRSVFEAVVLRATPVRVVANRFALTDGAVHKLVFDARRRLRRALAAHGFVVGGQVLRSEDDRPSRAVPA